MERQGLAGAGEATGMAAQMGGVLSNQTKVMKTFQESMSKGVEIGIEKSLVKDLTMAATSIAEMGTSRVSSLEDILEGFKGTLSGMKPGEIGKQDIKEALEVNQAQKLLMQGGGTAEGMATQFVRSSRAAEQAGFDNLDVATKMALAQATSREEVTNNPALMRALQKADPTGENLGKLIGTDTDNIKATRQKGMLQLMAQSGINEAGELSTERVSLISRVLLRKIRTAATSMQRRQKRLMIKLCVLLWSVKLRAYKVWKQVRRLRSLLPV